jgi:hypothetical protein
MKSLVWNSNGFRDPQKFRFILDKTRELNLAYIAILETGTKLENLI